MPNVLVADMADFDFLKNPHEMRAFTLAVGMIVLSVFAYVALAFTGGSILFYIIAFVAIAVGLYMAYHISKGPEAPGVTAKPTRTARKGSRKR